MHLSSEFAVATFPYTLLRQLLPHRIIKYCRVRSANSARRKRGQSIMSSASSAAREGRSSEHALTLSRQSCLQPPDDEYTKMAARTTRSASQSQRAQLLVRQGEQVRSAGLVVPASSSRTSSRESSYDHLAAWRANQAAFPASAPSSVGQIDTDSVSHLDDDGCGGIHSRKTSESGNEVRPKRMVTTPHRTYLHCVELSTSRSSTDMLSSVRLW